MSNFGLIRRDYASGNKIRLGITSYAIIFIASLFIFCYIFLRMSGFGPSLLPTDTGDKEDPHAIPTNVDTLENSLSLWTPNALDADGNPYSPAPTKQSESSLSTQTAVFSGLSGQNYGSAQGYNPASLNFDGLEQLSGDDGGLYIKSNFNVFTLNVPAGTKLSGKNNTSYIVGDDLKLYQVAKGGKRLPVGIAPNYKLWDDVKRFYTVSRNLELRLHTPGPKGRFVGPDGKAYNVLSSGDLEDADTSEIAPYISGNGEFTGTDSKPYVVMNGMLFQDSLGKASFGASSIGGKGYFKGPDMKTYMRGEDGKVYLVGEDNKLTPSNIGGVGNFVGPDGGTYFKDENGDIRRVLGGGENGIAQKTSLSKGYFIGPDGKKYYINDKGEVFAVDANGNLIPAKIGGTGIFRGPDGKLYKIDENGNITNVDEFDAGDGITGGKYLTGPDGKRYYVAPDGKTYLVDENGNLVPAVLPKGVYVDENGNTYTSDGIGGLHALSQKIPQGTYTDAAGKKYYVDPKGKAFLVNSDGSLKELNALPANTLLTGIDGSSYKVDGNGNIKKVGADALASGYFIGPDGKRYYKDKNGQIYAVDKDGKLTPIDNLPTGSFIGPDGQLYHSDGKGNITKLTNNKATTLPEGYFYGPDGKMYFADKNGKIYAVGANGTLTPVDKLPAGTFIGPDGNKYSVDGNGNIIPLDATDSNEDVSHNANGPQEYTAGFGILPAPTFDASIAFPADPKKRSATVSVTQNLTNFDNGDKNFEPVQAAKDIKGGRVYTRATDTARKTATTNTTDRGIKRIQSEAGQYEKFMPIGTRIPFYLLTHISTNLDNGSLIEGVVAENVFFHKCAIPAGTRIYGAVGAVGKNNRISLVFSMLQYPNGKSISISADAYDVNMQFGLEAYWTPAPLWATSLKFANVGAIAALAQSGRKNDETGESIADLSEVQSYLEETVDEIIAGQTGYHTLPAGTPGVLMLTQNLDLSEIMYEGSNKRTEKNMGLFSKDELLKRMKDNAEAAYQQQLHDAATSGTKLVEKFEVDSNGTMVRRLSMPQNTQNIPSADALRAQYDAQRNANNRNIIPNNSAGTSTTTNNSSNADLSKLFQ